MNKNVPYDKIAAFRAVHSAKLPADEFAVAAMLARSGLFDSSYYAESYKDVDASGLDPIVHYLRKNHTKGRKPAPWFDGAFYLKKYPDVAKSGCNPFLHFILHGSVEGRQPNAAEVAAAPDKAKTQSRPELHGLERYDARDFWICGYEFKARYYRFPGRNIAATENNLVFITDRNYLMPATVAANSFIVNSNKPFNIFLVAVDCIDEMASAASKLLHKGCNINIVALNNPLDFIDVAEKYITVSSLYKFVIPDLLYNRNQCLYVDADVIAFGGWDDIFSFPMRNMPLAAVSDFVAIYEHRRDNVFGISDYFNGGVLKMDLAFMREHEYPQKCVRLKLDDKESKYKFQDQDIFNVVFHDQHISMPPSWNYMLNYSFMDGTFTTNFHCRVLPEQFRILHYSWIKPWLTKDALMGNYWHDEYRRLHGRSHPMAPYMEPEYTEARQNEYFRLAQPRRRSVLCIEMLHCHGEVMPGFVKYFQDRGFNVDVIWHNDLHKLDSLALMDKTRLRIYWNWQFSHDLLLTEEKINQYDLLFMSSRTCYPGNPDGTFPTLYDIHPWLNNYKYKIVNMEHHLDSIVSPPTDNYVVLANPAREKTLTMREVNFPDFGNVKIKREKGSPTRFIVVGNIEQHRKNFKLLLETLASFKIGKYPYHVDIVAMRNKLEIPENLKSKISFYQSLSFKDMYRKMEAADYILALLDPAIKEHGRYLHSATSGTFQLAYAFRKPCIIHSAFAVPYYLNDQNSVIYNNNAEFGVALWRAIFMHQPAYAEMVDHMDTLQKEIMRRSGDNMDNLLRSLNLLNNE